MDNYKYKLSYIDNDTVVDYDFNAEVDVTEMAEHLRRFLAACSWSPVLIDRIICASCD